MRAKLCQRCSGIAKQLIVLLDKQTRFFLNFSKHPVAESVPHLIKKMQNFGTGIEIVYTRKEGHERRWQKC